MGAVNPGTLLGRYFCHHKKSDRNVLPWSLSAISNCSRRPLCKLALQQVTLHLQTFKADVRKRSLTNPLLSNLKTRMHGIRSHQELATTGLIAGSSVRVENATGTIVTNPAAESITQSQVEAINSESGDKGNNNSTLKSLSLSRKAFTVQDKLWSIYVAGKTVPIQFLKAIDISPLALVSDNIVGDRGVATSGGVALEAVKELFSGDGQTKKGRRGQNEVNLSYKEAIHLQGARKMASVSKKLSFHNRACDCWKRMIWKILN